MRVLYLVVFFVLLGFVVTKYIGYTPPLCSYARIVKGSVPTCKKSGAEKEEPSTGSGGYAGLVQKAKAVVKKVSDAASNVVEVEGQIDEGEYTIFTLRSGKTVKGLIRHEDEEYYTVAVEGGSDIILFKSDVAKIE